MTSHVSQVSSSQLSTSWHNRKIHAGEPRGPCKTDGCKQESSQASAKKCLGCAIRGVPRAIRAFLFADLTASRRARGQGLVSSASFFFLSLSPRTRHLDRGLSSTESMGIREMSMGRERKRLTCNWGSSGCPHDDCKPKSVSSRRNEEGMISPAVYSHTGQKPSS